MKKRFVFPALLALLAVSLFFACQKEQEVTPETQSTGNVEMPVVERGGDEAVPVEPCDCPVYVFLSSAGAPFPQSAKVHIYKRTCGESICSYEALTPVVTIRGNQVVQLPNPGCGGCYTAVGDYPNGNPVSLNVTTSEGTVNKGRVYDSANICNALKSLAFNFTNECKSSGAE